MKNKHIAFFIFPLDGHVNPTLSMVATLVRRGYRVTYVTAERFASSVAELGAEWVAGPANPYFPPLAEREKYRNEFTALAGRTSPQVARFYEENRPDLIVYDVACLAGWILAEKRKIPAIQLISSAFHDKAQLLRLAPAKWAQQTLSVFEDVNGFLEQHGIFNEFPSHREPLNVFLYPREFNLPDGIVDERAFFAGRCPGERPYLRRWRPENIERPVLMVTASSVYVRGPGYFKMCIEALSGLGWHVVLVIGRNNDPRFFHPLPAHFEIVQHIPQIQVLAYADLVIGHGGLMMPVESMYHGVPLLMLTQGLLQLEIFAENNVRLGIGRHLEKNETSVESIRSAIIQMAEDRALFETVAQMQRVVQRNPGAEETANRIAEYLEVMRH